MQLEIVCLSQQVAKYNQKIQWEVFDFIEQFIKYYHEFLI